MISKTSYSGVTLMKIAILHAPFEVAGGGERFVLELCRALSELGYDVELVTSGDIEYIKQSISLLAPNLNVKIAIKPTPLTYHLLDALSPGRFVRLKALILAKHLLEVVQDNYDEIFETRSNIPLNVDVSYIHYPAVAPSKSIAYRIYDSLIKYYAKSLQGIPKLVLTNSSWTARKILEYYPKLKDRVHVLYPPVEVVYFSEVNSNRDREDLVVTVSRFTPEKKLDKILEVAKNLRNYKFILAGSTGRYSQAVIKQLKTRIENEGLDNVELLTNIPRDKLRELLGRAKYYLHPPFPEHFGIAVVEAMAAGCIPIVYRDGGAWFDIASRVSDILGYSDVNEVPGIIRRIESDRVLYEELKTRVLVSPRNSTTRGLRVNYQST